jgi:site-specific recombinase XerD
MWSPNQLRHNAATRLRREHGIDMARIILGHSNLRTTEVYAEADRERAIGIMAKIG